MQCLRKANSHPPIPPINAGLPRRISAACPTMKILISTVAALWAGSMLAGAAPADLLGTPGAWKQAGPGEFKVADGVAVAHGGMGLFWNPAKQYKNFTLRLQFSWDEARWNSGVFVRFPDPGNDPWVAVKKGYEIQLSGREPGKNATGAIYDIQGASHLPLRADGEWNDLEVTAVGPWIAVLVNDELVNLFRTQPGRGDQAGFIGLQNHDDKSATRFRKVTVSEWPEDASFLEAFTAAGHGRGQLASYFARLSPDAKWYDKMDTGPAFYQTFGDFLNGKYRSEALKGVVLRPSPDPNFVALFDTEAGKLVTATDRGLTLLNTPWQGAHGRQNVVNNTEACWFNTDGGPGWANAEGKFADTRELKGHGNYSYITFRGHHRHGSQVVLDYTVHDAAVLDTVSLEAHAGVEALARTLTLASHKSDLLMLVADAAESSLRIDVVDKDKKKSTRVVPTTEQPADGWALAEDGRSATSTGGKETGVALVGASGARLVVQDKRLLVKFPAGAACTLKVIVTQTQPAELAKLAASWPAPRDLAKLSAGPALYPERFTTQGKVATGNDPWLVDTLTLPPSGDGNPYHANLRFSAFDFFADGNRAALCTWEGDVWIVSGLKGDWKELTWNRFATGLFEPLGLRIVDDVIYVNGRDQLLTLHDTNGDGEADDYRTFNRDVLITDSFHEFSFDLQTDADGNLYFAKAAPVKAGGRGFSKIVPHNGVVARVSKDGKKLDVLATGLRAPGGMAIGPDGAVTTGENEGTWIPACKINYFLPERAPVFLGVEDTRQAARGDLRQPLCYLPMSVDNSGGGQVWVPENSQFGLQPGELIHLSYGQSSLYRVLKQPLADGRVQGGVVRIPVNLLSSAQRARFHNDGSAFVLGFRGWQTNASTDCAFHRIRFNNQPILLPNRLEVVAGGIRLGFEVPLDKELAEDPASYSLERWKYIYCSQYGSGEFSIDQPDAEREKAALEKESKGSPPVHDKVTVAKARLLDDGKSVLLEIPDLKPAMQMKIAYDLESTNGKQVIGTIYNTIHEVPEK